MAGRKDYEERKQARIDRLENAAYKARRRSETLMQQSNDMVSGIPMGQPIITGRGARTQADINRREKSWNKIGKAVAEDNKATYLESKAEAAANNYAISSDDPNSVEKLQAKIDNLKTEQTFAKSLNAYYKKNKTCNGFQNLSEEQAAKWDKRAKDSFSWEKRPFPSYELTSINGKIKAAQERINKIKAVEEMPEEIIKYEFCEIESNADTNRVTILFYDKQPDEVIEKLKRFGFKWAYSEGKWQRLRSPSVWRLTKNLIDTIS